MKTTHFVRLRRAACSAALTALAALPGAAAAQAAWTLYTYAPAATLASAKALTRMAETLQKETGGAFAARVHLGGSLPIQAANITQAVADNVVQLGDDGFFQGNIPVGGVMRLPMLITSVEEMARAGEVIRPYLQAAYAKKNMELLGYYHYPLQTPWSNRKLASLEDLKGMKMRVTSAEQGEFVRRFGGVGVTIGASEVPSALDRGVVDGVFTAASGGGKIWKDLLKYQYGLGPNYFDAVLVANKDALSRLPATTQSRLRALGAEAAPWITAELAREEGEVAVQLKAAGIAMAEPTSRDRAEGVKRMASYWDEWARSKGPEAAQALKKVRAVLNR